MRRLFFALAVTSLAIQACTPSQTAERGRETADVPIDVAATDWPWWRGPDRNGIAATGQNPPKQWSAAKNVRWKSPVPGRGHGSPTVVGDRVFLAAANEERGVQSVLCFDRDTGEQLWETVVHKGGLTTKGNKKSTQASCTPACDGTQLFINFLNSDAVYTTALSVGGEQLWQQKISDYVVHQGYGSSPALYGSLVIVSADNKGGGAIAALDRSTGDFVWKHERPQTPNYASPIILNAAGREQLVFTGCDRVSSFDPLTGETIWETPGATTECVTSTVTDGQLVFSSGGYPKNHVAAIRADGSGEIVWEKNVRIYVPSMLVKDGHLYTVTDAGIAICWKCDTGDRVWNHRLSGTFTASPVLVGEDIYVTNEAGRTYIFKAKPDAFELIAENQLGDEAYATPAICGNRIYTRVAEHQSGRRQEMLYCLETKE